MKKTQPDGSRRIEHPFRIKLSEPSHFLRRPLRLVVAVFVSLFFVACPQSRLAAETPVNWESLGYKPLFNGTDLQGWRNPYDFGEAKVVDGELHLTASKKFFLVTEKQYSDFRLVAEIHLPQGPANSGIMFRAHVEPNRVFGYQAECDGSDRRWSGGLYDEGRRKWIWPSIKGRSEAEFLKHEESSQAFFQQPAVRDALKRNDWNRYVIECRENRIQIELNGVKITDLRDDMDRTGFIGIQHHGEKGQTYRFRNIYIKELPWIPAEDSVHLIEQQPVATQAVDGSNGSQMAIDFGRVAYGNLLLKSDSDARVRVHMGEKLSGDRIDRKPPGTVRYYAVDVDLEQGDSVQVAPPADARNTEQVSERHPPAVLTPEAWGTVVPFRWVEIESLSGDPLPAVQATRRAAFQESWDHDAADFVCSDQTLNDIWELCRYSILATTFAGVYVDGDRERIPYEADAYLNQLSHYATDSDVSMARDTFDWLIENGTWPSEWAPHMVFMAHADWMHTGDLDWLRGRYALLKSKLLSDRIGPSGLVESSPQDRKRTDIVDWPVGERDGYVFQPINTVVNAFHLAAIQQMQEMATALQCETDADEYAKLFSERHEVFQRLLFDTERGVYRDGIDTDHSSLHANLFPLAFGLVPPEQLESLAKELAQRGMRCSVYAAQYLMEALFQNGADREAMELILADNDRSWKHMLDSGTTITWEAWDQKYKPNQDWNHAWGAAPANLFPRFVLGVETLEPGWSTCSIQPRTSGLSFARGKVPTPHGPVEVDWNNEQAFTIRVTLPEGVAAMVSLPAKNEQSKVYAEGNEIASQREGEWLRISKPLRGQFTLEVRE